MQSWIFGTSLDVEDHGVGHFAKLALNFASEKGWSGAAQAALDEAKKTINGILGVGSSR